MKASSVWLNMSPAYALDVQAVHHRKLIPPGRLEYWHRNAMAGAPVLPRDTGESTRSAAAATASLHPGLLPHRRRICRPVQRLVSKPGPSRPAACGDSRRPRRGGHSASSRLDPEARPGRRHLLSPGPRLVPGAEGGRERHRREVSPDRDSTEAGGAGRPGPRSSCPPRCGAPDRECGDPSSIPRRYREPGLAWPVPDSTTRPRLGGAAADTRPADSPARPGRARSRQRVCPVRTRDGARSDSAGRATSQPG